MQTKSKILNLYSFRFLLTEDIRVIHSDYAHILANNPVNTISCFNLLPDFKMFCSRILFYSQKSVAFSK